MLTGYVRLVTSAGPLNLELHCDMVPKICDNFIKLCQSGYYNNTKFHRSIRHFMVSIYTFTSVKIPRFSDLSQSADGRVL